MKEKIKGLFHFGLLFSFVQISKGNIPVRLQRCLNPRDFVLKTPLFRIRRSYFSGVYKPGGTA